MNVSSISFRERLQALLQLVRPANIVTALADILAGFAASGIVLGYAEAASLPTGGALAALLASTAGLYGGGVVLNDVFDASLDARERPERPLPSRRVSQRTAALFGCSLLLLGVAAAWLVSWTSMLLATGIALAAVAYDAFGKHHPVIGPLNMGACRGGNLLLGVSAVPAMVASLWFLALIPIAYITAITAISRGEVHGGTHRTGVLALVLIAVVITSLLLLGALPTYRALRALPFAALFAWQIIPPFVTAARSPRPATIRTAVKTGVLALIPLNAVLAAGFAGWLYGLAVLALWPLSYVLGRVFAVT